MTLSVSAIRDEAEGIRSFDLQEPDGAALPPVEAGAHLRVEVTLPSGRTARRHYSLLGDPQDRHRYRIAVRLELAGRGGSRYLHQCVHVGSRLRVEGPDNAFTLHDAPHTVLIAGGIGITPILSMVRALARHGRSYEVHYVARTQARMAFREELACIAGPRAHLYVTEASSATASLADALSTRSPGTRLYVCGPPRLLRDVSDMAARVEWPPHHIHTESFGPQASSADHPLEVRLTRSALTLTVGAGETILDALLTAGIWVPYECQRGTCAACMTRVVAGTPDHRDSCLSDALRAEHMCVCVSRAHSRHLTLDL
jgi:ferredoxin-NADP reductase